MVRQKEADCDDPDEAGKASERNEEEKFGEDQVQPAELACGSEEDGFFNAGWRRRSLLESVERNDRSYGLRPSNGKSFTQKT